MLNAKELRKSEEHLKQLLSPDYQPLAADMLDYNSSRFRLDIANLLTKGGFIKIDEFYNLYSSVNSHYKFFPFTETPSVNRHFCDVAGRKLQIDDSKKAQDGLAPADCIVVDTFGNPSKKVALLTHHGSVKDMKEKKLSKNVRETTEFMSKHDFVPKQDILDFKDVVNRYGWAAAKRGIHPLKACLEDGKVGRAQSGYALYNLDVLLSEKENLLTI